MAAQAAPDARPGGAPSGGAPQAGRGGGDNLLTHKVGPIPVWGYGVVLAALLVWRWYSAAHSSAAATSGTSGTGTPGTSADMSQQVPQFVNQTYTTLTAPSAAAPPAPAPAPVSNPAGTTSTTHPVNQFSGPANVAVSNVGKNTATVTWKVTPTSGVNPASYTVGLWNAKGTRLYEGTVNTPDTTGGLGTVTIPGLPANTQIHGLVWPNGGKVAPKGAPLTFHTAA